MTCKNVAFLLLVGLLGVCQPGSNGTKGPTDLLADQADAVVVAQVQSGQQAGYSVNMVLSVVRTLKGPLTSGDQVSVAGTTGVRADRVLGGQYGLWFLKNIGGQWGYLPVFQGRSLLETSAYFPLVKTASPASLAGITPASLGEQIAAELAAAVQSYQDPNALSSLAWGLFHVGQGSITPALFQTLRASSDPEIRLIGLTGAWNTSADISALGEIADDIATVSQAHTSSALGIAVCATRDSRAAAVQQLGRIAASADVNLARCAIMALDFIHTLASLPILAQSLDSADPLTREYAMQGLSRFVDNLPIQVPSNVTNGQALVAQGPTPYRTAQTDRYSLSRGALGSASESEYLQFWRSWWSTAKDKLSPGGQ